MAYIGRASGRAALVTADIPTDSINSDHYVDGSIDNAHLADDAVGSDELADSVTLVTPNLGTPSAVTLTNATFPTAVGGGLGGHVVSIKQASASASVALARDTWSADIVAITHTMQNSTNVLLLLAQSAILLYVDSGNESYGSIGFSKDGASPFYTAGARGFWSDDPSHHDIVHPFLQNVVTVGDTSSHVWSVKGNEYDGVAIVGWPDGAVTSMILMELTGP